MENAQVGNANSTPLAPIAVIRKEPSAALPMRRGLRLPHVKGVAITRTAFACSRMVCARCTGPA